MPIVMSGATMRGSHLGLGIMRALGILKRSVEEFLDDNCIQMAAAISYYVLLSL